MIASRIDTCFSCGKSVENYFVCVACLEDHADMTDKLLVDLDKAVIKKGLTIKEVVDLGEHHKRATKMIAGMGALYRKMAAERKK